VRSQSALRNLTRELRVSPLTKYDVSYDTSEALRQDPINKEGMSNKHSRI